MSGVEHPDPAGIQAENQPFLRIDSDAMAREFSTVENESDPMIQLDAQFSPSIRHFFGIFLGDFEPLVDGGQQPFRQRSAIGRRAAFNIHTRRNRS